MKLPDRVVAINRALTARRIPHAFGGAIALAYWTLDPRGTSDIDVNIFVAAEEAGPVLTALPQGIARPAGAEETVARDGQIRLWWDETPIDLFFDYMPLHVAAAKHRRVVPFADTRIPVLGPVELAVFKVMFDRTRDWADLEEMIAAGTLDVSAVHAELTGLVGRHDPRHSRLDQAERRAKDDS